MKKLVIDISEDDYEIIKYCGCLPKPFEIFRIAIQNGTPLEEEFKRIKADVYNLTPFELIHKARILNILDNRIAELKGENNE